MPSKTFNRMLWALALLLIVVFGFQARDQIEAVYAGVGSLDVRDAPEDDSVYLRWKGKIEAPMANRLEEAFKAHKSTRRRFVLSLTSPGGTLSHGAQVVDLLRTISKTHVLETVIDKSSRCASMCVPVYLQGQRRTASASARFMFHEVSFREFHSREEQVVSDKAKGSATDRLFANYFAPAGVPDGWIRTVLAGMAGGNDIWKTGRELADENAGIVQQLF